VSFFGAMAVMPQLVLAAQSCPKGLEGLVFSIFAAAGHVRV